MSMVLKLGNGEVELNGPRRRRFSAGYKLKVLAEVEACSLPGQIAALLRRELHLARRSLRILEDRHVIPQREFARACSLRVLNRYGVINEIVNHLIHPLERQNRIKQRSCHRREIWFELRYIGVTEYCLGIPISLSLFQNLGAFH
jgi:hypothetical protein